MSHVVQNWRHTTPKWKKNELKKDNSVMWMNKIKKNRFWNKIMSNRYEILPQELKKKIRFFSSGMNGGKIRTNPPSREEFSSDQLQTR